MVHLVKTRQRPTARRHVFTVSASFGFIDSKTRLAASFSQRLRPVWALNTISLHRSNRITHRHVCLATRFLYLWRKKRLKTTKKNKQTKKQQQKKNWMKKWDLSVGVSEHLSLYVEMISFFFSSFFLFRNDSDAVFKYWEDLRFVLIGCCSA